MATHTRRFDVDDLDDSSVSLPHDVTFETTVMVNVILVGDPDSADKEWVLVDAGLPGFSDRIVRRARQRFGDVPPRAIVLTHGHFDHIGSLRALLEIWPDTPVYAHTLERPYLEGRAEYPPPDPTVGGGIFSRLSVTFPRKSDFSDRLQPLPDDGSVPGLPDWRWIHTPGHSPGHVSLYRESDGTLLAGDAFVTQKQESLIGVLTQHRLIHGPPMYFTPDWQAAKASVQALAALQPHLAITGHGLPMANPLLDRELSTLAREFDERAVPRGGRYASQPAVTDEDGVVSLPPKPFDALPAIATVVGITAVGVAAFLLANRSQRTPQVASVHDWLRARLS